MRLMSTKVWNSSVVNPSGGCSTSSSSSIWEGTKPALAKQLITVESYNRIIRKIDDFRVFLISIRIIVCCGPSCTGLCLFEDEDTQVSHGCLQGAARRMVQRSVAFLLRFLVWDF